MNELKIINDFVIQLFQEQNLVNTISIVPTMNIDANKENIYPLVNIDLTDVDIQSDTDNNSSAIVASYKITVVQQREIRPQVTDSKLLNDTNYLDNISETFSIASRFINIITRLHNSENIMVQSQSSLSPLKNWAGGLDGFQFDVDLSIFNKDIEE